MGTNRLMKEQCAYICQAQHCIIISVAHGTWKQTVLSLIRFFEEFNGLASDFLFLGHKIHKTYYKRVSKIVHQQCVANYFTWNSVDTPAGFSM